MKLADDGSGDVVIRLYEALGTRTTCHLDLGLPVGSVFETDLLERPTIELPSGQRITMTLAPFQILTLRLVPSAKK